MISVNWHTTTKKPIHYNHQITFTNRYTYIDTFDTLKQKLKWQLFDSDLNSETHINKTQQMHIAIHQCTTRSVCNVYKYNSLTIMLQQINEKPWIECRIKWFSHIKYTKLQIIHYNYINFHSPTPTHTHTQRERERDGERWRDHIYMHVYLLAGNGALRLQVLTTPST